MGLLSDGKKSNCGLIFTLKFAQVIFNRHVFVRIYQNRSTNEAERALTKVFTYYWSRPWQNFLYPHRKTAVICICGWYTVFSRYPPVHLSECSWFPLNNWSSDYPVSWNEYGTWLLTKYRSRSKTEVLRHLAKSYCPERHEKLQTVGFRSIT